MYWNSSFSLRKYSKPNPLLHCFTKVFQGIALSMSSCSRRPTHLQEVTRVAEQQCHIHLDADQLILFHNNTFEPGGVKIENEVSTSSSRDSSGIKYLVVKFMQFRVTLVPQRQRDEAPHETCWENSKTIAEGSERTSLRETSTRWHTVQAGMPAPSKKRGQKDSSCTHLGMSPCGDR